MDNVLDWLEQLWIVLQWLDWALEFLSILF
jgi:hypothetical protein